MTPTPVVLVVEDDEDDQFFLERIVSQAELPCQLVFARDGAEALERLASLAHLPDFILTDLNMPRLNGLELLKTLKASPLWVRIPVILFSTTAASEVIAEAYSHGACSFVQKPASIEELANVWQSLYQFSLLVAR